MLRVISNILWVIFGGLILMLLWAFIGVLFCVTIVGIPFGVQCFKAAKLSLVPYGKKVVLNVGEHPVANVLWALIGGWGMALLYFFFGILNCITIIGIPKGIQCFKIMKLAFFPFGAEVVEAKKSK